MTAARSTFAGDNAGRSPGVFAAQADWWDDDWSYRVPLSVNAGGFARQDKPAEASLNFTQLLNSLGNSGPLDINSLRVVEVDGSNNVLDAAVPFQFDPASDFNASANASGLLTFMLKGSTASNATRQYHVYFDVTGKGFAPAVVAPQVTTTDNVSWLGYSSIRIQTPNGDYYYHKPGGGFASLFDSKGKDWLSWSSSVTPTGAAGDYRGIPNMVPPPGGGFFHPGRTTSTTTLLSSGPLKATFRSTNNAIASPAVPQGAWEVLWEVFPSYARMTVTKAPVGGGYWFLYEGTPGGTLEANSDFFTLSNGTTKLLSQTWSADIPNEEWLFFGDPSPSAGNSIYLAHHQDDDKEDAYWPMDNLMTVFGFGRKNPSYGIAAELTGVGRQFTFGLADSTDFSVVGAKVRNAYKALPVTIGSAAEVPPATTTATVPPVSPTVTTPGYLVYGPVVYGFDKGPMYGTGTPTPTMTTTPTETPTPTQTPTATPTETPTQTATNTPVLPPTNTPVSPPATPVVPGELVVYDWNSPVTKADHGFPSYEPPWPSANGDWTTPNNFAEGTFYFRVMIYSMPASQLVKTQFCVWQVSSDDVPYGNEICSEMAGINYNGSPAGASWDQSVASMYVVEEPIDWTRPRQRYGVVIKNQDGLPVSDYVDWNWNGENPDEWYPMDLRFTVVVVEKDKIFSGWENYP